MNRALLGKLDEASVRAACVHHLGTPDVFYGKPEADALGEPDVGLAEELASMLSRACAPGLVDMLEETMTAVRSPETRHDTGTVYTPQEVVDSMVADAAPARFDTVVDMGCGCGRFVLAAAQAAPAARVIGIDEDPLACLLAATASRITGTGYEVVRADFLEADIDASGRVLYIGNPPYVRHHMLSDGQKALGRRLAEKAGLAGWSGLSGLYALFMAKVLADGKQGDRMVVVTGAEWMDVGYGAPLRAAFASEVGGGSALTCYPAAGDVFGGAMTTALVSQWELGHRGDAVRCRLVGGKAFDMEPSELGEMPKWGAVFHGADRLPAGVETIALGALFRVSRGIVTGNNGYFVVSSDSPQAEEMGSRAVPVVARAADVPESGPVNPGELKKRLLLLDPVRDAEYIRWGAESGVADGYVASHRTPWFGIDVKPAPVLATYMRRGRPRFAANPDGCPNLNTVHGLYPRGELDEDTIARVVDYLNTGKLYGDAGRVYQGGLVKYEPGEMERIEIPASIVGRKGVSDGER